MIGGMGLYQLHFFILFVAAFSLFLCNVLPLTSSHLQSMIGRNMLECQLRRLGAFGSDETISSHPDFDEKFKISECLYIQLFPQWDDQLKTMSCVVLFVDNSGGWQIEKKLPPDNEVGRDPGNHMLSYLYPNYLDFSTDKSPEGTESLRASVVNDRYMRRLTQEELLKKVHETVKEVQILV